MYFWQMTRIKNNGGPGEIAGDGLRSGGGLRGEF